LGITPIQAQKEPALPKGQVHASGRAVADARGPFTALGATLFWGAWGYKFDRPRLERALSALAEADVDYVRVLGSVGGETWQDRQTDPRWEDYDETIAGLTDLAYGQYGIRVQWTLFGGAPFTESSESRRRLVDRFVRMVRGREHKVFALEIANEAWQNGFEGRDGRAELRSLAKRLDDQTNVIVSLSAPAAGAACETYAGASADAITMHYERGFAEEGPTRALRRPWTFPRAYDAACRGKLPSLVFNNEPIGPESSVREDDDPGRIAAGFVMTFLAGNAAYVLHTGPGIRGGGKFSKLERSDHFDELPSFDPIVEGLRAAKTYLPEGLPNWNRHEPGSPTAPLTGSKSLYLASSGGSFVGLLVGNNRRPVTLRARTAGALTVRRAATGRVVKRLDLNAGETFRLPVDEPTVLIGKATS
jgi:hypothetical protein